MKKSVLHILWDEEQPEWVYLKFPKSPVFVGLVKKIGPSSYRRFDAEKRRWEVHVKKVSVVVSLGRRMFDHVDWSKLPLPLQVSIARKAGEERVNDMGMVAVVEGDNPYDVLHLQSTAPMSVVKAVYRVLALETHPDQGGSDEAFKAVNEAYETIKAEKGNDHADRGRTETAGSGASGR